MRISSHLQHLSNSVRRRKPVEVRSFWNRAREIFSNVFVGDDYVNPMKLLERKYLYFSLLALQYRQMRIEFPEISDTENEQRARDDLEAQELHRQTNVDLRYQLQDALHPQVHEIFQAFASVDKEMNIQWNEEVENPLDDLDWDRYSAQLEIEYQSTNDTFADDKGTTFLKHKLKALELVLEYHHSRGLLGSTKLEESNDMDAFGVNIAGFKPNQLESLRRYQTLNLVRSSLIRKHIGYSALCLKSSIPNAGRGVFVEGRAPSGSILGWQPGETWPKEHLLTTAPEVVDHFNDDDEDCQVSLRFDGYVVDSRQAPVTVLTRPGSNNPWALGHMVNHGFPNCQSTMINFHESHNVDYLPNSYAKLPTWRSKFFEHGQSVVMHGLCLLAKRDVVNEEILYDYRLQSKETPDWYKVIKEDDDDNSIDQVVFFREDWKENS